MRVIAGEFGGRRLQAPRGARTRPTADRVREALFSMLGDVTGARVLDLYAGSGALGIEALSRGAASAMFVDDDPRAATTISRNLAALGAEGEVRRQDVERFLATAPDGEMIAPARASPPPRARRIAPARASPPPRARRIAPARAEPAPSRTAFDLVFCDPPYDLAARLARTLAERLPDVTSEHARIVTESDKRRPLELPWPLLRERTYGDTRIAIHGR